MNYQEMLDIAVDGIIAQGGTARQTDNSRQCVYLDKTSGRMCAIGLLMTPEELEKYGDSVESVDDLLAFDVRGDLENVKVVYLRFLMRLQRMHDELGSPLDWESCQSSLLAKLLFNEGDMLSISKEQLASLKQIHEGV